MRLPSLFTSLLLGLVFAGSVAQAAPAPIKMNQVPQDATLREIVSGTNKRFSSYYGQKGTLVFFWHPRNKTCVDQLYAVGKAKLPPGIKLVTLTLVNDTDLPKAKQLAKDAKVPALLDTGWTMAIQLKADVIPSYYLLGPGGTLLTPKIAPVNGLKEKLDFYDNRTIMDLVHYLASKRNVPALVDPQGGMIGKAAPGFKLKDLGGRLVQMADYKKAKGLAVIFYSPTCPHCQRELPRIHDYLKKGGYAKGYKAVAIALGTSDQHMKDIREYQSTSGYSWPVMPDPTGTTMQNWKVQGYPTVYLVGPDGKVKSFWSGTIGDIPAFFEKGKGQ